MSSTQRELFVYYRVDAAECEQASGAVRAFQQALRTAHPALTTRLLRRPETKGGQVTLMEMYALDPAACPDGIDDAWLARIEGAAIVVRRWQHGERHVEWFDPLG
ncbi:MAG: DUF4936 family protein [Burkholderiaceae bacterium]